MKPIKNDEQIVNPGEGIFTVRSCDLPRIRAALAARGAVLSAAGPKCWIVTGEGSPPERHSPGGAAVPVRRTPTH